MALQWPWSSGPARPSPPLPLSMFAAPHTPAHVGTCTLRAPTHLPGPWLMVSWLLSSWGPTLSPGRLLTGCPCISSGEAGSPAVGMQASAKSEGHPQVLSTHPGCLVPCPYTLRLLFDHILLFTLQLFLVAVCFLSDEYKGSAVSPSGEAWSLEGVGSPACRPVWHSGWVFISHRESSPGTVAARGIRQGQGQRSTWSSLTCWGCRYRETWGVGRRVWVAVSRKEARRTHGQWSPALGADDEQVQGTWGDKLHFPKPRTPSSHPPLDLNCGYTVFCFFSNWFIVVDNGVIIFAAQQSDSVLHIYSRLPRWR